MNGTGRLLLGGAITGAGVILGSLLGFGLASNIAEEADDRSKSDAEAISDMKTIELMGTVIGAVVGGGIAGGITSWQMGKPPALPAAGA